MSWFVTEQLNYFSFIFTESLVKQGFANPKKSWLLSLPFNLNSKLARVSRSVIAVLNSILNRNT